MKIKFFTNTVNIIAGILAFSYMFIHDRPFDFADILFTTAFSVLFAFPFIILLVSTNFFNHHCRQHGVTLLASLIIIGISITTLSWHHDIGLKVIAIPFIQIFIAASALFISRYVSKKQC